MHDPNQPNQPPTELTQRFWQAWREQEGKTPRLAHLLLQRGRQLLERFQHFHSALSTLSRPGQLRWQRKLGASLAGVALTLALSSAPVAYAFPPGGNASLNGSVGCDLIDAITAANTDTATGTCPAGSGADTITLLSNVTLVSENNGLMYGGGNGLPIITSAITIEGNGAIIARAGGAPQFRILEVAAGGDLTLNNTTITGGYLFPSEIGYEQLDGSGILNFGTLTLTNSTVSGNNQGIFGGGISNEGTLTLSNSTVSGNNGSFGGGISNQGTLTLSNSTISGNTSGNGGGMSNFGALTLSDSTVSGNTAGSSIGGGGIYNFYGTLTLERSLISGNSAASGREIFNYVGGCLSAADANTPDCLASVDTPLPATDPNLFGHSGESNAQAFVGFTPAGSDITATSDGTTPTALSVILDTTLQVNAPGNTATHALVTGSPAVDAASDGPATDQRGVSRPQGSGFDIGAFELEQAANQAPVIAANNASVTVDEGQTAANAGTVSDPDNDPVTLSASVGAVVNNGDGTWSWSLNTTDGPPDSATVTITADDGNGGVSQTSFGLTVNNVAPTISSVSNDGPITAGGAANITVTASDPAGAADPLAYEFDCDNNGSYEVGPQAGNSAVCSFASAGAFPVNVRVNDGDGGVTAGSTVVTVNPPAPASASVVISSDSNGSVPGLSFRDEDIMAYNPNTGLWSLVFDGSDVGLGNVDVDAFAFLPNGHLLLSVDKDFTLNGFGWVDDSDILEFIPTSLGLTTSGSYLAYFDGSDVGLDKSDEDVDAIDFDASGNLLVSVNGEFKAQSVKGADEDLFKLSGFTPGANTNGTWSLYFDGSDVGLTSSGEDIFGVWADHANSKLYLTTHDNFSVPGASGDEDDIFVCTYTSLGSNTACTFTVFWNGDTVGFDEDAIDGLSIGDPPVGNGCVTTANASTLSQELSPDCLVDAESQGSVAVDDTVEYEGDDANEPDPLDGEETTDEAAQSIPIFLPLIER